jgi:hypothetical protein
MTVQIYESPKGIEFYHGKNLIKVCEMNAIDKAMVSLYDYYKHRKEEVRFELQADRN